MIIIIIIIIIIVIIIIIIIIMIIIIIIIDIKTDCVLLWRLLLKGFSGAKWIWYVYGEKTQPEINTIVAGAFEISLKSLKRSFFIETGNSVRKSV